MRSVLVALVFSASLLSAGSAAAQSLRLEAGGRSAEVTLQDIRALPHVQVHVDQHGHAHDFSGVPLGQLLGKVGVDLTQPLSGPRLAAAVRVTARDGYQVVLALSELDPATRSGQVIVADADGGKPISDDQGPLRLVISDDLRPARSPRQLERIEVLDLSTLTKAHAR